MKRAYGNHYRAGTNQTAAYTVASAPITNAVGSQTYAVRLVSTTDCHITFAATPVATTGDPYLPANTPEIFTITPGQKVAAIRASADGTLHVTELTQ